MQPNKGKCTLNNEVSYMGTRKSGSWLRTSTRQTKEKRYYIGSQERNDIKRMIGKFEEAEVGKARLDKWLEKLEDRSAERMWKERTFKIS